MSWNSFHHPDIVLPVIRRKASDELITILGDTAKMVLTQGRLDLYGNCYPNNRQYKQALKRLESKGLVATSPRDGSLPVIRLTEKGENRIPHINPEKYWNKPWNKWWYILMFDVPEKNRSYRDTLRKFLKKNRFGCLQKSVWVTPRDFRADYDDLNKAAGVDSVAYLFEARTVLGYGYNDVVREAWNLNKLIRIQEEYMTYASENLEKLNKTTPPQTLLIELLKMENTAYAQAMALDPLLPHPLYPQGYVGPKVANLHRKLIKELTERL